MALKLPGGASGQALDGKIEDTLISLLDISAVLAEKQVKEE